MKILLSHIILLLLCHTGSSQVISDLKTNKDTVELGQTFQIYYQLKFKNSTNIKYVDFSVFDSIESRIKMPDDTIDIPYYAEIEWEAGFMNFADKKLKLNPSLLVSSNKGLEYRDTFNCTFWDIGVFPIPHPHVVMDSSDRDSKTIDLQTSEIIVLPPLDIVNPDSTSLILAIEPIITEGGRLEDYYIYMYLLGFLLIAAATYWIVRKRHQKEQGEKGMVTIIRPAHEIALEKLAELRGKKLWESGQIKAYQSELTHIIRAYLEQRYSMLALESTTDQILRDIEARGLDLNKQSTLKEILQIADLVKFAKANPPVDIHERFLRKAENFIEETKEKPLFDPQKEGQYG